MIRVLHVIDSLGLGGAQTVVLNLATHADKSRVDHRVLSLHGPGPMAARLTAAGVQATHVCARRTDPFLPFRLVSAIRAAAPDVLHLHLVVSCLLGERLRPFFPAATRMVCHVHNHFARHGHDAYQERIEHWLYRRCDAVVACGEGVAESVRRGLGGRHAPITVIPNGVADAALTGPDATTRARIRQALGIPEDAPVILSAGRLNEEKNLAYALDIVSEAQRSHPGLVYLVAGSGPQEAHLKAHAGERGLGDSARFLGYRDDAADLMRAADLFLMTSWHEGLPLALAEAMGAGTVCAATRFDSLPEVLDVGRTGIGLPFGDAVASGRAVAGLLGDPDARARLAEAALADVRARLSASSMAARAAELYESLMRG